MKKLSIIFAFVCFFCFPFSTRALICSYTEGAKFKNIAGNVHFYYDYTENEHGVSFQITATNLHSDIYMIDKKTGIVYENVGSEVTISGYQAGEVAKFEFWTRDHDCARELLSEKYVTLPPYNSYYKSEACKGIENYKLCQKWYQLKLSYDDFLKETNLYRDSLIPPKEEIPEEKMTRTFFDILAILFEKYYIFLFGGIVFIGGTVLVIYYKKHHFKF